MGNMVDEARVQAAGEPKMVEPRGKIQGRSPQDLAALAQRNLDIYVARVRDNRSLAELAHKHSITRARITSIVREMVVKLNKLPYGVVKEEWRGKHLYLVLLGRFADVVDARRLAEKRLGASVVGIELYELYKGYKFEYIPMRDTGAE